MPTTVILLCAAATPSSRIGGFPAPDEPLDEAGQRAAARCGLEPRFHAHVALSPSRSARETAAAMKIDGAEVAALADIDHGRWSGRAFADLHAEDAGALAQWLADPTRGAPGGESMTSVVQRAGAWLDAVASGISPVCAITHATVIRATLAYALRLPLPSTLMIDVAPLARAVLSFNRGWRLQSIGPAA